MLAEPDVALTDWGLAIESGLFAWRTPRPPSGAPLGRWLALFFASIAAAALTGGAVHAFFVDGGTLPALVLWRVTLVAIGITALAAAGLGASLLWSPPVARAVVAGAVGALVAYTGIVGLLTDAFAVAIVAYVPAAIFLFIALLVAWWRGGAARLLVAVGGLLVMLAGSWVQWAGVTIHPRYLTHNAFYHVIEAVALALIFAGTRALVAAPARSLP